MLTSREKNTAKQEQELTSMKRQLQLRAEVSCSLSLYLAISFLTVLQQIQQQEEDMRRRREEEQRNVEQAMMQMSTEEKQRREERVYKPENTPCLIVFILWTLVLLKYQAEGT